MEEGLIRDESGGGTSIQLPVVIKFLNVVSGVILCLVGITGILNAPFNNI